MNKNALVAMLAEHGDNLAKLARLLGISPSTVSKKVKDEDHSFSISQMKVIKSHYQLSAEDMDRIFFGM